MSTTTTERPDWVGDYGTITVNGRVVVPFSREDNARHAADQLQLRTGWPMLAERQDSGDWYVRPMTIEDVTR